MHLNGETDTKSFNGKKKLAANELNDLIIMFMNLFRRRCLLLSLGYIYPTKKKRNSKIFPLSFPFNTKMLIVIKFLVLIKYRQNSSVA